MRPVLGATRLGGVWHVYALGRHEADESLDAALARLFRGVQC